MQGRRRRSIALFCCGPAAGQTREACHETTACPWRRMTSCRHPQRRGRIRSDEMVDHLSGGHMYVYLPEPLCTSRYIFT
jgi:hypothetical protein